ncbi:hypothetical protein Egran_02556, partial [Elaphomyces granulatus]
HSSYLQTIRVAFESRPSIFVPATGVWDAVWAVPSECLWEAPLDMESKYPLKSLYESYFNQDNGNGANLTAFFEKTLSIPNASTEHFLEELKTLKSTQCTDFDRINRIYESIDRMRKTITSAAINSLKNAFKDEALIYVVINGNSSWVHISQCLWSTATHIPEKIALNDQYCDSAAQEDFFVDFLGVQTLTLQMVIDKLKGQGAGQLSVKEIKQTIWVLNSFLQSETEYPNPEPILKSHIFPVRDPDGQVELCTSAMAFAIADRKHLYDLFSNKAKIFDFNLNDVSRLEPFLKWAGLENRYLSCSVKEISTLCGDSNRRMSNPDRDISRKSHGLLRIAVHFRSPRVQNGQHDAFYEILKRAETRETDGICSELRLNQGVRNFKVETGRSELHIGGNESELKVYVPLDEKSQELCFSSGLSKGLLEWIMTDPLTQICGRLSDKALYVMQQVLGARKIIVSEILDRQGIVSVEAPDDYDLEQPLGAPLAVVTPTPTNHDISGLVTPNEIHGDSEAPVLDTVATPTTPTPAVNYDISAPVTPNEFYDFQSDSETPALNTPASSISSPPSRVNVGWSNDPFIATPPRAVPVSQAHSADYTGRLQLTDLQYRSLLDRVIAAARRTTFPSRGAFDMSALGASLTDNVLSYVEEPFRLHSDISRFERDKMIGAAGELFVFEILSHLHPGLTNFSRGNWQSTIRKYVTIHQEYSNMDPWNGRETTDIRYDDHDGILTSLFIEKEYLSSVWAGRRPKYFIEVKSTTGPCHTPFFMSKNQYQMMQDMSNGESGLDHPDCIYVVFRVFNLGRESIDMRLYVDPDVMRARRKLLFTAESWTIVPGPGLSPN